MIDNKIIFPALVRFQDPPFLVEALSKADTFYGIKKKVYCYRLKTEGVQWNARKIADLVKGIMCVYDFAQTNGYEKLKELMQRRMASEYGHIIQQGCQDYIEFETQISNSASYK